MAKNVTARKINRQGFTLIELSIVLVIIGLIVGGILVGQDLIKAAQLRATITQLERYDSAVNTFRGKFGGLPGDLQNAGNFFASTDYPQATNCLAATLAVTPNNGVFEDCGGARVKFSGEPAAFWRQLYDSALIGDAITDTNLIGGSTGALAAPATITAAFPTAKLGNGNFIMVYTGASALTYPGMTGVNLYRIASLTAFSATGAPTLANAMTALEAFQIDSKKDDGIPNSGIVQGTDNTANFNTSTDAANTTYDTTSASTTCLAAANLYNTGSAAGTLRNCQLVMRTSF